MGRLLAAKVRCYEYNWACARMKRDPPALANPQSNAWKLVPDQTVQYSAGAVAACREAQELLRRVTREHPGTSLALLAQEALKSPFSFKWAETYVEPAARETQAAARAKKQKALLDLATRLARQKEWGKTREALGRVGDPTPGTEKATVLLDQRGDLFALLGLWDRAAADYSEIDRLWPEIPSSCHCQILALLAAGDRGAAQRARFELLNRFRKTTSAVVANSVAWSCVLAPLAVADADSPVRLAETAVKGFPAEEKHTALNTLGATLYRTRRFEDAIQRLEEGIQLKSGASIPQDWVFLAMAHHRLGHRDEARRWLDRFRNRQPSADPDQFWTELEIRLLRSEAEALVLYDPVFPADPFAH